MSSVSYLRNNDYTVQKFKPFELPYNAMMQTAQIKNNYFKETVAGMQQEWSKLSGLDPLNVNNKKYLQDFEKKALEQFQKVAKSDLTISGNQQLFSGILDPLYDMSNKTNANLLYDDDLNKFFKKQAAESDKMRKTANGKNWHEDNDFYFRSEYDKYQKWAASGEDPSGIKNFQKKPFIPYYPDTLKDLKTIKDLCPEDKNTVTGTSGMYFNTHVENGVTVSKMNQCLSMLPDQAKQQIKIKAYRQYYNNREGLLNNYKERYLGPISKNYDIAVMKLGLLSSDKTTSKEDLKKATDFVSGLKDMKDKAESGWSEMIGPDSKKFIDNNYDELVESVGMSQFMQTTSENMSYKEVQDKLSPDAVKLAYLNINAQKDMQNQRLATQVGVQNEKNKIEYLKEGYIQDQYGNLVKIPLGSIGSNQFVIDESIHNPVSVTDEKTFETEKVKADQRINSAVDGLVTALKSLVNNGDFSQEYKNNILKTLNDPKVSKETLVNMLNIYDRANINDIMLDAAKEEFNQAESQRELVDNREIAIQNKLPKIPAKTFNLNFGNNTFTVTQEELLRMYKGEAIRGVTLRDDSGSMAEKAFYGPDGKLLPNGRSYAEIVRGTFITNEERELEYKKLSREQWSTTGQWAYTTEVTSKDINQRDIQIADRLKLPPDVTFSNPRRNAEGDVIVTLWKKNDKEFKEILPEDMKGLNIPTIEIENVNTEGKTTKSVAVIKNLYPPLSSFNLVSIDKLNTYADANFPTKINTWANTGKENDPSYKDLYLLNSNGQKFYVRVGNKTNPATGTGSLIFKVFQDMKGTLIQLPEYFYSADDVISAIEKIKITTTKFK